MTTTPIPGSVLLCAIGYYVTVADDMVMFSAEPGIAGCFTRLVFTRACGCWHVEIFSGHAGDDSLPSQAMVSHIMAAQNYVNEWFGGNHSCPRGENRP